MFLTISVKCSSEPTIKQHQRGQLILRDIHLNMFMYKNNPTKWKDCMGTTDASHHARSFSCLGEGSWLFQKESGFLSNPVAVWHDALNRGMLLSMYRPSAALNAKHMLPYWPTIQDLAEKERRREETVQRRKKESEPSYYSLTCKATSEIWRPSKRDPDRHWRGNKKNNCILLLWPSVQPDRGQYGQKCPNNTIYKALWIIFLNTADQAYRELRVM